MNANDAARRFEFDDALPDLRLAQECVDDPWQLSEEQRCAVVEAVVRVASFGRVSDQLAAAHMLMEMDMANLKWRREEMRAAKS